MSKTYSVVDIETTGGIKGGNRITEISIINFDGEKVLETYTTLINPEKSIPPFITRLTGIDNSMVSEAPYFYEVAKKIVQMTEGNIFVAHNVFFDFNFIKHEFAQLGYSFRRDKLCTVRLARRFLPGHSSYSLGKICKDLGIEIEGRHRAHGDASATVKLLKIILNKTDLKTIAPIESKKMQLPQYLKRGDVEELPHLCGVYYFYNVDEELVYIGKSKNIKTRILGHLRANIIRKKDVVLKNSIARITYELTGNELAALLIEASQIKQFSPAHNVALKKKVTKIGIKLKTIQGHPTQIVSEHKSEFAEYDYTFSSKKAALKKINEFYKSIVGHDADSLFFETSVGRLIKTIGLDRYNKLVEKHYFDRLINESDFYLKLRGRSLKEKCIIEVRSSYPVKVIYINDSEDFENSDSFDLFEHQDLKNILNSYIHKHKLKITPGLLRDYDRH